MLSLNYENIIYVMTQILKLSCVSFSYVRISYVLADQSPCTTNNKPCLVLNLLWCSAFAPAIVLKQNQIQIGSQFCFTL